jgi:RNA polymerase sigma factor (TIGR02999 family)
MKPAALVDAGFGDWTDRFADADGVDRVGLGFSHVYDELKLIAHRVLARSRNGALATTGLVHEAYLKLSEGSSRTPADRKHFLALCARSMRQIVIDHARRLNAEKRGAGQAVLSLHDVEVSDRAGPESFLAIDRALDQLERHDRRLVDLIQLRVFAGLDLDEIAPLFGVTVRQLQRDWLRAQIWLVQALLPDSS